MRQNPQNDQNLACQTKALSKAKQGIDFSFEIVRDQNYQSILAMQESARLDVLETQKDEVSSKHMFKVFLVEHLPVITFGRGEKGESLKKSFEWLSKEGFELSEISRGGKITYHGPGQLVVYPVVSLKALKMGVKQYVCALEKCMQLLCEHWGVQAHRKEGFPGIWLNDQTKLGSVGIHVRKSVSIHGFSLNIQPNLQHFDVMAPCGLEGVRMSSIAKLSKQDIAMDTVFEKAKTVLSQVLLQKE